MTGECRLCQMRQDKLARGEWNVGFKTCPWCGTSWYTLPAHGAAADLDVVVRAGQSPETIERIQAAGLEPGQFANFASRPLDEQHLILGLMERPVAPETYVSLDAHPNGREIAQYVMTLPPYRLARESDIDDE